MEWRRGHAPQYPFRNLLAVRSRAARIKSGDSHCEIVGEKCSENAACRYKQRRNTAAPARLFGAFAREVLLQPAPVERALHVAMTSAASPLPIRFVGVSARAVNRWMQKVRTTLSTGTVPTAASIAASTTNAAPGETCRSLRSQQSMAIRPSCLSLARERADLSCDI
jgi:hypothetical protein